MCAADCSCLTRMCLKFASTKASYIGRFAPPGSPKTTSTPSFSRAWINAFAPVISTNFISHQIDLHKPCLLKHRVCPRQPSVEPEHECCVDNNIRCQLEAFFVYVEGNYL